MSIVRDTINGKPLTVVGHITAIHSIIYGLGFILLIGGFTETALYENVEMSASPLALGIFLLVVGLMVKIGLFTGRSKLIGLFSALQSMAWAFVFFIYLLNGQWFLGLGTALVWSILSSYVSYVHSNKEFVLGQALKLYKNDAL